MHREEGAQLIGSSPGFYVHDFSYKHSFRFPCEDINCTSHEGGLFDEEREYQHISNASSKANVFHVKVA